jgi:hypothetical protein
MTQDIEALIRNWDKKDQKALLGNRALLDRLLSSTSDYFLSVGTAIDMNRDNYGVAGVTPGEFIFVGRGGSLRLGLGGMYGIDVRTPWKVAQITLNHENGDFAFQIGERRQAADHFAAMLQDAFDQAH